MSELGRLPGPYELLDLKDQQSVSLRVQTWEQGMMTIVPKYPGAPPSKDIVVLRVHLAPGVKAFPPPYWDLTSKTLQAQLLPMLLERDFQRFAYGITAYGEAPGKRFTVSRSPL